MSKGKQIDQKQVVQMARDICVKRDKPENCKDCDTMWCKAHIHAFRAYKAGYRKQIEAEWIPHRFDKNGRPISWYCSNCRGIGDHSSYCSHCGAKMKGCE